VAQHAGEVTSGVPTDERFRRAIWKLVTSDISYAELWRELSSTADRAGLPRPCYHTVREVARGVRGAARLEKAKRDQLIAELLAGYIRRR
jgi:hypothetical protein